MKNDGRTEQPRTVPAATLESIDSVANLEKEFLDRRSAIDRVADAVGDFTGSLSFVIIHLAIFAAWFLINTGHFFRLPKFDPFPFVLLAMVVSVEAVLLSTFVLMKQNRMAKARRATRPSESTDRFADGEGNHEDLANAAAALPASV